MNVSTKTLNLFLEKKTKSMDYDDRDNVNKSNDLHKDYKISAISENYYKGY